MSTEELKEIIATREANLKAKQQRQAEHAKSCVPKLVDSFVARVKASTGGWGDWEHLHIGTLHPCYWDNDADRDYLNLCFESQASSRLGGHLTLDDCGYRNGPEKIWKFHPDPH